MTAHDPALIERVDAAHRHWRTTRGRTIAVLDLLATEGLLVPPAGRCGHTPGLLLADLPGTAPICSLRAGHDGWHEEGPTQWTEGTPGEREDREEWGVRWVDSVDRMSSREAALRYRNQSGVPGDMGEVVRRKVCTVTHPDGSTTFHTSAWKVTP